MLNSMVAATPPEDCGDLQASRPQISSNPHSDPSLSQRSLIAPVSAPATIGSKRLTPRPAHRDCPFCRCCLSTQRCPPSSRPRCSARPRAAAAAASWRVPPTSELSPLHLISLSGRLSTSPTIFVVYDLWFRVWGLVFTFRPILGSRGNQRGVPHVSVTPETNAGDQLGGDVADSAGNRLRRRPRASPRHLFPFTLRNSFPDLQWCGLS